MQSAQPKSKLYGALVILGIVIGLGYWHLGASRLISPSQVTLPPSTAIALRLDQTLSSKISIPGQHFRGKLAQPLMVDGRVAVPAGTEFSGVVSQAVPAAKLAGGAVLRIDLTSFSFQGKEYPVQAPSLLRITRGQGKRIAKVAMGGALIGAVVGALANGKKGALIGAAAGVGTGVIGAAATNKPLDIVLPAESLVTFHLAAPITVAVNPVEPAGHFWLFS
jgi:hypothetical protein